MSIVRSLLSGNFATLFWSLFSRLLFVCLLMPVHELAHGYVSYKLGDPTAKKLGRLTLNPLKHIDPMGTLTLLLFGFGWAKPVPIDPRYYKNRKRDTAIVSLAGPLSNIIVAFVFLVLMTLVYQFVPNNMVSQIVLVVLRNLSYTSVFLAVFNMIPVPPLGGSKVLAAFLPDDMYEGIMDMGMTPYYIVLGLIISGVLDRPLFAITEGIIKLLTVPISLFL